MSEKKVFSSKNFFPHESIEKNTEMLLRSENHTLPPQPQTTALFGGIQTIDLRVMSSVLYHCAIVAPTVATKLAMTTDKGEI